MKNKNDLLDIIKNYGIPPFDKALIDTVEYSIRLRAFVSGTVKVGATKFGGSPHLPDHINWPKTDKGNHFSFLAQINLSETTLYDTDKLLPKSGMLYFFSIWKLCLKEK